MHELVLRFFFIAMAGFFLSISTAQNVQGQESARPPVSFRATIAPILIEHCVACHGSKKAEGGYRLDTWNNLLEQGDSGIAPISMPGDTSPLLHRLISSDPSERMPLESDPLSEREIGFVKDWLLEGASFDGDSASLGKQPLWNVLPEVLYPSAPPKYPATIPITAVAFRPDGQSVVVGGYHEVVVWDVAQRTLVRRIGNLGERIYDLEFSPDGKWLAVAYGAPGKSGEVRLLQWETGEIIATFCRSSDVVFDIAFTGDGKKLGVGLADGTARIFDTATRAELRIITSHSDWVEAVAWSDDGTRFATASRDKTAKVFHGETGELLATFSEHGAPVQGIAFAADGKSCITTGGDKRIRRWEVEENKKVADWAMSGDGYKLKRSGSIVFVPSSDKKWYAVDLNTNQLVRSVDGHTAPIQSLQVSGDKLATGDFGGEIRIWNAADGASLGNFLGFP